LHPFLVSCHSSRTSQLLLVFSFLSFFFVGLEKASSQQIGAGSGSRALWFGKRSSNTLRTS
jgi:hypothetical protein